MINDLTFEVYGTSVDADTGEKIKTKTVYYIDENITTNPMIDIAFKIYNLKTKETIVSPSEEFFEPNFEKVYEGIRTISVDNAVKYFETVFSQADKVVVYAMDITEQTQQFVDGFLDKYDKDEFRIVEAMNATFIMTPNEYYPNIERVNVRAFMVGVPKGTAIKDVANKIVEQLPYNYSILPDSIEVDMANRRFTIIPINFKVIYPDGRHKRISTISVLTLEEILSDADKKPVAVVQLIRRGLRRYHAYVVYKRTKDDRIRRYAEIHASKKTSSLLDARGMHKTKRNMAIKRGYKSKKRRN